MDTDGIDESCVNLQSIRPRQRLKPHILVADDDAEMRALLTVVLQRDGYEVVTYADGLSLVEYLESLYTRATSLTIDLVICDMRMPGLTGLEVLERIGHRPGFPPVILMTAFGDSHFHQRARQLGAYASLDKPFEVEQLLDLVRRRL